MYFFNEYTTYVLSKDWFSEPNEWKFIYFHKCSNENKGDLGLDNALHHIRNNWNNKLALISVWTSFIILLR